MSFSSAKRRRIKPFARPTSFDINVAFDIRHYQRIKYGNVIDPYFPAVATDEAFKVLEGEILMQTNKPNVRRYGDHQMHVFSFANGLKADDAVLNASYVKDMVTNDDGDEIDLNAPPEKLRVLRGLRYAGVAVTEFTPEKDVFEQGFVLTMGGLNTLFNNGASTVYPGDVICADIPNVADRGSRKNRALQTGVPHEKLQFVVTPFRLLREQVSDAIASRFIMGTALSYSRPGTPLDVVLHRCNHVVDKGGFELSESRMLKKKKKKVRATLVAAESKKPKVKAPKKTKSAESKK